MKEKPVLKKHVVILTYKFSVVVKGLEKDLISRNFHVTVAENMFDNLTESLLEAEIFILYLPEKILDNDKNVKKLLITCDNIKDHGKRLFLIGAGNSKDSFFRAIPAFKDYVWFDRPIDVRLLMEEIEKELQRLEDYQAQKRILIVDDDPFYAQIVREWLSRDYLVDSVTDGMDTITFLNNHKVNLILLDYDMPILDGPKILEMLRAHYDTKNIPVMFLTGISSKECIKKVMLLKPQGYILKTTTKEKLLATLNGFFAQDKEPKDKKEEH